jgi:hypothetical protein
VWVIRRCKQEWKEKKALPGIHGNQEGDDSLKILSADLGKYFELSL